jgi:hypothetical protein
MGRWMSAESGALPRCPKQSTGLKEAPRVARDPPGGVSSWRPVDAGGSRLGSSRRRAQSAHGRAQIENRLLSGGVHLPRTPSRIAAQSQSPATRGAAVSQDTATKVVTVAHGWNKSPLACGRGSGSSSIASRARRRGWAATTRDSTVSGSRPAVILRASIPETHRGTLRCRDRAALRARGAPPAGAWLPRREGSGCSWPHR